MVVVGGDTNKHKLFFWPIRQKGQRVDYCVGWPTGDGWQGGELLESGVIPANYSE